MPLDPNKLKNAVQRTENQTGTIMRRKECGACHETFDTLNTWEKRCNLCRMNNAVYTKRVYNKTDSPF